MSDNKITEDRWNVYCIGNTVNTRLYIGITKHDPQHRFKEHVHASKNEKRKQSYAISRAIRKFSKDKFFVQTIFKGLSLEDAILLERYLIETLCTMTPDGYNLSPGGEMYIGYTFSEETRKKISDAGKGRKTSDETKEKISKALKGKKKSEEHIIKNRESHKGLKRSESSRRKQSQTLTGRKCPESQRENISRSLRGKPFSEAHRENIRIAALNRSPETRANIGAASRIRSPEARHRIGSAMRGKKHTEETRRKISEAVNASIERKRKSIVPVVFEE